MAEREFVICFPARNGIFQVDMFIYGIVVESREMYYPSGPFVSTV